MIYLTGGIVTIEYLFAYPGLGSALAAGVQSRDLPLVQAIVLLFAASYVLFNLLADVLTIWSRRGCGRGSGGERRALAAARGGGAALAGGRPRPALGPHAHRHRASRRVVVVIALIGPFVAPHDPARARRNPAPEASADFPLGTDYLGHDVLSRAALGRSQRRLDGVRRGHARRRGGRRRRHARGLLARSRLDDSLMRVMDVILAFPQIVLVLLSSRCSARTSR